MPRSRLLPVARYVLFAAALVAAAQVREFGYSVVDQAIIWLPTGVAVAGLWLLGLRACWVVALATMGTRVIIGYGLDVAVPGALGSVTEAVLGAWVLRRLGFDARLERLRDILAVALAAIAAPTGSIMFSWIGRALFWSNPHMPFYSGWDGWWRMNALGAMVVVPLAANWLAAPRPAFAARAAGRVALVAALQVLLVGAVFFVGPGGVTGILLLHLGLLVALVSAVRFGPRGAVTTGAFAAILVAGGTAAARGPFLDVNRGERLLALQLFELLLVALPLVFGALVAEKRAAERERERSDEELSRQRELLAAIHRNVSDGLYRSRPDGGLLYVNEAFARMFGFASPEEATAANTISLHVDPARRDDLRRVADAQGFTMNEEVQFRRRDGSTFWSLVSSTAVRGPDGATIAYDGAITDITAWKGLEDQLRQSQRLEAVGQLAGGIAHDFNNVLTVIVGYAELIRASVGEREALGGYAQGVLKASERAASLTRQLLAYSRRQVLSPQVLDLREVVAQLGEMLQRLIGEDIRLQLDADVADGWVRVDRGQLEQVILNLVVNARDAMPAGGVITISTGPVDLDERQAADHVDLRAGPWVRLVVRDTGAGMSSEVRARAFDPFFTTKERGRGTGLGLSTVYGIIKQSGGAITLDSQPGQGTAAVIHLPRVAAPERPTLEPETAPDVAPTSATLLFVEDEPLVRELSVRFLSLAGYRVLEAADGVEALEVARRHDGPLDLLVTDVVMPRLGGRELAATLLAERPALRVLFISGYAGEASDLREVTGDAADFLQKPFRPESLNLRVRALLDRGKRAAGATTGGGAPA